MKTLKSNLLPIMIAAVLLLIAGCSSDSRSSSSNSEKFPVKVSVERTGGLINGIGTVKIYVDDEEVFKLKNKQTKSVDLLLPPGVHTIQSKGQGDKSKSVKFEVIEGQDNVFHYQTEISHVYGISLERMQ